MGKFAGLGKEPDHELEELEALDWHVQPVKITAHQDRSGYVEGQVVASLFANVAADRLADNVAGRQQLDAGIEISPARTDACAKKVLFIIATIEKAILEAPSQATKKAQVRRAPDLRESWIRRVACLAPYPSLEWEAFRLPPLQGMLSPPPSVALA